jgi:integrase
MNNIDTKLLSAGVQIFRDSVDVEHLRFTPVNKKRVRRFEAFQNAALKLPDSQDGVICSHLIAFDLVAPTDVPRALVAVPFCYRGGTFLEWAHPDDERLDRRHLTALTVLRWNHCPPKPAQDWTGFTRWLVTLEGYKTYPGEVALKELELDLYSWVSRKLPMALFGHVTGLRVMHALSREVLAREASGFVKAIVLDEKKIERETQVADFMDTVDEIDIEKSQSDNYSIVGIATKLLTTKRDEAPSDAIDRWVNSLLNLRARVQATNVATAIVLSWMLDLCESGTSRKTDADHLTRRRYCVVAGLGLWRMLSAIGSHPEGWDKDSLEAGYLALMEDPTIHDKRALGAALSSFQSFLHEHWDIELPMLRLHKLIPLPRPRVQFVSNLEINRAQEWISGQQGGDRTLLDMSALALALGACAPFRIRELLYLRIQNVTRQSDGTYEIEIVRFGWRNKLKSAAAVRRVQVREPRAATLLAGHLEQRRLEGASTKDLLFAAPLAPSKIYRQHALHRTLLRLLKLTTGDPSMTFHALRHSWASREVGDVLCSDSIVDYNRLIHIAEQMGHVSPGTTLSFYSHIFENALYVHTSSALQQSLELSAKTAQSFTGVLPNTLNTNARRKGMNVCDAVWRAICNAGESVATPCVTSGMDLIAPPRPVLSTTLVEGLTPIKVLEALRLLRNPKLTDELVAARTRTSLEEVKNIRTTVCRIAIGQRKQSRQQNLQAAIESVDTALAVLGINLERAFQPKFANLKNALAVCVSPTLATEASQSWLSLRDRGYLAVDNPRQLPGLLRLLHFADMSQTDLLVCMQYTDAEQVAATVLLASILESFQQVWTGHPSFVRMDYVHPARPSAYLTWPGKHGDKTLEGPAGVSIAGLEALMLAVTVYINISEDRYAAA